MNQISISNAKKKVFFSCCKLFFYGLLICATISANSSCKKKGDSSANEVPCYKAENVNKAYTKVKSFLSANEAAYGNGTIDKSKIGLYIDMVATKERMDYYINIIALGKGVKVPNPDGTTVTIDDELIRNYKEALCNETDDVNKKL